eukprot:TRINITY_DN4911_c0_g1_i1.p1 TRINITY_DN4911_c0_g1~~TRINITY_DN4911_c0_g1_i1.p1  ORF type:complete len:135 (-),score=19.12 TRINITY_DN4911_c0_g1_i1:3-365(-)
MSGSTGFLVKCDAVFKQYILYLHELANQTSGDAGALEASRRKKQRTGDDNTTGDAEEALEDNLDYFKRVQITDLDDTHLFLTGAPLNLQAALQREVDKLHDKHTYLAEGSDVRDNKFTLS